ncbi:MAG TPA: NUDIX hydrolase, partial [Candidatus Kapabacteria bacterium]|nr:NUDIX hydrolase [Candidatus Kapabacteria bacterium]
THDQKILLIHQYYFIHERKAPTLVAGFVEDNDHRRTAENELREEAGCVAGDWTYLGSTYRGKYETGVAHFYLAKDVVQVGSQDLEPAEDIDVSFVSVSDFITLLKRGELQDVFPVACAYRALDHLHLL